MNPQEAISIVREACAHVTANLPTHQRIQAALETLNQIVNPSQYSEKEKVQPSEVKA